jgi:hypothetical protein
MNLLGHFVCARNLRAEVQAGSALGDLLPLYRRRVRPLALAEYWAREAGGRQDLSAVEQGVRFHLLVDSRFHRDPLFTSLSGGIQGALREASGTPGLKRFFPAHILSEMFLDHLLIESDGAALPAFYELFDGRIRGLLAEFAAAHADADGESFRAFLARFVSNRFLDGYRDLDGIFVRMQRMLTRFGQRELEPSEIDAVRNVFTIEREFTQKALLQFVASMRHADRGHFRGMDADTAPDGWDRAEAGFPDRGSVPAIPLGGGTSGGA